MNKNKILCADFSFEMFTMIYRFRQSEIFSDILSPISHTQEFLRMCQSSMSMRGLITKHIVHKTSLL